MREDGDDDRILTMLAAGFATIDRLVKGADEIRMARKHMLEWYLTDNHSTEATGSVANVDGEMHGLWIEVMFDSSRNNSRAISRLRQIGEALQQCDWLKWEGCVEFGFTDITRKIEPRK